MPTKEASVLSQANFDDPALNAQFRQLGLCTELAVKSDITRPSKRRKISSDQSVLSDVVAKVYSLLGSQEASDLDGLSQVAAYVWNRLSMYEQNLTTCQRLLYPAQQR